jgi:exoribonuclease R
VPLPPLRLDVDAPELRAGLARIRADLEVPGSHGPEATAEAEAAVTAVLAGLEGTAGATRVDERDVPFITIDPPGSRDLDQALHLERQPGGRFRVRYAIADVAAFVTPGGALDREVWARGVTYYLPDERAPLHPAVLGEGAASLLPDEDRPAVLWTIDLDRDGVVVGAPRVERAIVRSRAQLTYTGVQAAVDAGRAEGTEALLAEVGALRQAVERDRGGVSLDLPTQRVARDEHGYHLEHEAVVPAMGWNAQVSLLTGMTAAAMMLDGGVGLLRTLPPPAEDVVDLVRRTAGALGVSWPAGSSYADVVRGLDGAVPAHAALLTLAARGLRGAGYLALAPGSPPLPDPTALRHAAVAAPYAHVTAPLRRLADRHALEVCLALHRGEVPPSAIVEGLEELPRAMGAARSREGSVDRAVVDLVESLLLESRVGTTMPATVVAVRGDRSTVVLRELAVQAAVDGVLPLGEVASVRIDAADPATRTLRLVPG